MPLVRVQLKLTNRNIVDVYNRLEFKAVYETIKPSFPIDINTYFYKRSHEDDKRI